LQVTESLDSRLAELNRATEKTYHEIDLIREYRTRLISDVVTGQLDVREATGNLPAEVEQPSAAADDETEELLEAVADDE
jgi:type I restriction enzyme S subunit